MSNVILITSSENEAGKSIIALKTAVEFSEHGLKTVIVDLSNGKTSIAEYSEIDNQIIYDIQDVIEGTCNAEHAAIEVMQNLFVLPSPRLEGKLKISDKNEFNKLILDLKKEYDCIIIDGPIIIDQDFIDCDAIDYVLIVNNTNVSSIRNTHKILNLFNNKGKIFMIINKYNKENIKQGLAFQFNDIKSLIPIEVLGYIKYDEVYKNIEADFFFKYRIKEFNNILSKVVNLIK